MKPGPALRLVVTVNEADRWHGRSVYNALLELFHRRGLAGATVSRGIAGFTGRGRISTVDVLDLGSSLPVRIEVVDAPEAIEAVVPDVYEIVGRGLVEIQETRVVKFAGPGEEPPSAGREELMRLVGQAKLLQVHVGADDQWEGAPLHEAIVRRARQLDVAGATVYRGELGYGAARRIHKHRTFALSKDDPMLITAIDTREKIDELIAAIDSMISGGCLITVSDVTVVQYRHAGESEGGAGPEDG